MRFDSPQWLWLLSLLPVLSLLLLTRSRDWSLPYTSLTTLLTLPRTLRQRLLWLPSALLLMALGFTIIALGNPQREMESQREHRKGIAIEILVDVSSSMRMPLNNKGKSETRMEAAKDVLQRFVLGDGKSFKGLDGNLIGLITFARYADTVCPLTFGVQALADIAADLDVSNQPNEDGTAYGDAVALAAARLHHYENLNESQHERNTDQPPITSKVVIVLTDGENNSGRHLPMESAAMAKAWGIRIYTISLGQPDKGEQIKTGGETFVINGKLNEADWTLKKMAEATGGIFRQAHDYDTLQAVYAEIDRLEKSEILTISFQRFAPWYGPCILLALFCLLLSVALEYGPLRRLA
jgi:Ca-activated chloride channel homolog